VFVDRSGRRLRRLRLFGGITLGAVLLYVSVIATAFFGGSDVAMPFLPHSLAQSDDAGRPLPTNAPMPEPMQLTPAQAGEPTASESPVQPEPSEPAPATPVPEPTPTGPGRSETAPGQTTSPEPPAPQRP
jgi:hypothetical protein